MSYEREVLAQKVADMVGEDEGYLHFVELNHLYWDFEMVFKVVFRSKNNPMLTRTYQVKERNPLRSELLELADMGCPVIAGS